MVVPLPDLRYLGVELAQVVVQQVVAVVAAELVQRLSHFGLGLGDDVAPEAPILSGHFSLDHAVGIDGVATLNEEVRMALAHGFVDAHAAEVGIDAPALAAGIAAPDETDIPRAPGCSAQMAHPGFAAGMVAGVLETGAVEDRLIRRQPTQIDTRGEVESFIRDRRNHPPSVVKATAGIPLHHQPRRAITAAPDHGSISQHVTGLHAIGDPGSRGGRCDDRRRNAERGQRQASTDALNEAAACLVEFGFG